MPGKRNADDKKEKLIRSVGETLKDNGYHGMTLNKVTLLAGVSKPMVYQYFANFNGLLKAYIAGKDTWVAYFRSLNLPEKPTTAEMKSCFVHMLQDQFRYFHQDREMQKLVHWQMSGFNPLMRATCENREREGARLLEIVEEHFRNSGVSLKAVLALLVGGIYYNVLHDSAGLGTMAGVDIRVQKDFDLMLQTIEQVIGWAFDAGASANAH